MRDLDSSLLRDEHIAKGLRYGKASCKTTIPAISKRLKVFNASPAKLVKPREKSHSIDACLLYMQTIPVLLCCVQGFKKPGFFKKAQPSGFFGF